jgi:cytochrome c biogenesis factor
MSKEIARLAPVPVLLALLVGCEIEGRRSTLSPAGSVARQQMEPFDWTLFFVGAVAFVANPFTTLPVPPSDGPGPNPLLQNHSMMAVHPVLTYLGVVDLTVPFAYAIAALITGDREASGCARPSLVDEARQSVVLRAVRSPLVTWIWFGALIVLLGTGYALSPQSRAVPARRREAVAR